MSPENTSKFYAQSWVLVHYLFRDAERRAMLNRYLTAINRGDDERAAFEREFAMTPAQLQGALRQYIRRGVVVTRLNRASTEAAPEVTVTRLPRSADNLVLLEASLKLDVPEDERAGYLARVRGAARPHGDDPYAMRVLAHAEALWGDGAAAERLLTRLLADRPNDPELLYLMGLRHFVAARDSDDPDVDSRAAQGWFVKAHQADPNHYPTLYRYAQSLRGEPSYVSENTSNILLLAHQLAPQVDEIRLNAAAMLMNRGEFADAEVLLAPLAASPHSRGSATAAKDLLAKARARERPGAAAVEVAPDEDGAPVAGTARTP